MSLLSIPGAVMLVLYFVLLAVKLFAFISAVTFSTEHYRAAGKWTKAGWVTVTGIAAALQLFPVVGQLINIVLTIAALVYLADVRPALSGLRRR